MVSVVLRFDLTMKLLLIEYSSAPESRCSVKPGTLE